jgi:RimJ/RimL family protein N-acetyltransferase
MRLKTDRLVLRRLSRRDVDNLAALHSDAEVTQFIGLFGNLDATKRIAQAEASWRDRGFGLMAIETADGGRFVGRCGLQEVPGRDDVELGWTLHREVWGRGYASEAAAACLRWGLDDLGLSTVVSLIHPHNERAARVATRIGMTHDGATQLRGINVDIFRAVAAQGLVPRPP